MLKHWKFLLLLIAASFLYACTDAKNSATTQPVAVAEKPTPPVIFSKWKVNAEKDPMTDESRVMILLDSNSHNSMLTFFCAGDQAMFNWKVSAAPRESYGGGLMDDMKISVDVRFDDGQVTNEKWVFKLRHGIVVPPKSFFDNVLTHSKVALNGFFITQDLVSVFEIAGLEKDYGKYREKCKLTNDSDY